MNDAQRTEARALLTRAATLEAQRQSACKAGDTLAQQGLEAELRRVWEAYSALEAQVA